MSTFESVADNATQGQTAPTEAVRAESNSSTGDQPSGAITVGDRTFNSHDELIKSWENAQNHIKTLESERAQDKELLSKAKGVEEVLERLQRDTAPAEQTQSGNAEEAKEYLTKDVLEEVLAQRESQARQEANLKGILETARKEFGDDFAESLSSKAGELGMSEAAAIDLAKNAPDAFSQLFMPKAPRVSLSSTGDINPNAVKPSDNTDRSAKVQFGAPTTDLVRAWGNAAPQIEQ